MHCQTEIRIPLKDTTSDIVRHSFMDFPALDKNTGHSRTNNSEKKVHKPIVPNHNDVLLGRGGKNNAHVGNEKLRELARKVAQQYHVSSKKEKSFLSRTLVQKVKEMDPPGRFLRRHPKENHWEDLSEDEDKCREKCAQVLRDAVAYVGLKEAPAPSMAQREQQLQQNFFSVRRRPMAMHPFMQQQPPMQMNANPFAMSANSSSQILRHQQQLLTGQNIGLAAARQFSFPSFNRTQVSRNSLSPVPGSFDQRPLSASFAAAMPRSVPPSIGINPGVPLPGEEAFRAPKRRRMSNPFFDPFVSLPGEAASFGIDRRLSLSSNSYPIGSDFQHGAPGPRVAAPRRDSLFGNVSLGPNGSDHSGPSVRDFELFPDLQENTDAAPTKNDNDEFSSDFY